MPDDPTPTIQALINNAVTGHEAIVVGLVSPDVAGSPTLLYAGQNTLWNTQHQPMSLTGDTPFQIASITKTFTSMVEYLSPQTYKATLGDVINVPKLGLPKALSSMPLLNLANYSPGFPTDNHGGWWPQGTPDSLESLLTYLHSSTNIPQNPTGSCYSYSNFGWGLLALAALVVQSATQDVLSQWANRISLIVTNCNMNFTQPYNSSMDASLPVGYNKDGRILPIGFNYRTLSPMLFGAGDLVSTGNDMLIWLLYNMGTYNPMATPLQIQQGKTWTMRTQCPPDTTKTVPTVSLAWFFHTQVIAGQQVTWLAKDGGLAGFTSWMGFQQWLQTGKASPIGAFVLTNSHKAQSLGTKIIQILFGGSPTDVDLEIHYAAPPE